MALFDCPLPAELLVIPGTECPVDFDQINRLILVRKTPTPPFAVTSGAPVITSAAITVLLGSATGNAKGVITPLFSGLTLPETEAIIEGENDNSTVFGAGEINGGNVVRVKAMFTSMNSTTLKALYKLIAERNLTAMFITKDNKVVLKETGFGFNIYNQFMSDVMSEGLNKKNKASFGFTLRYGWSLEDGFAVIAAPVDLINFVQTT